jgi:hypothetical protein
LTNCVSALSDSSRRSQNGYLEYHIPSEYTKERPALAFYHTTYNMSIGEHAVASRLPTANRRTFPGIVGCPDDFFPLMKPEGGPNRLEDYITSDRSQMGLYVISFTDKTIVTIFWPHTLTDVMGMKVVLDAWSLIMQGRRGEVVPPQNTPSEDPLAKLGFNATEPHKLEKKRHRRHAHAASPRPSWRS